MAIIYTLLLIIVAGSKQADKYHAYSCIILKILKSITLWIGDKVWTVEY